MATTKEQPTPLSLIVGLYHKSNTAPLIITDLDKIDIYAQLKYLHPDKCNTSRSRNDAIKALQSRDLSFCAHKRIRLKSILSRYQQHWAQVSVKHFKMIENWTTSDFCLSVIVYFIEHHNEQAKKEAAKEHKRLRTVWRFLHYLLQYLSSNKFDGEFFINYHIRKKAMDQEHKQDHESDSKQNNKSPTALPLLLVKEVCALFGEKTGQYVKVKKQIAAWVKEKATRYHEECNFKWDDLQVWDENENDARFGDDSSELPDDEIEEDAVGTSVAQVAAEAVKEVAVAVEKWYWLEEKIDAWQWTPYKDFDQNIIQAAWTGKQPHAVINETWKIKFNRDPSAPLPTGQQANMKSSENWMRQVVRGKPDSSGFLNGIKCADKPK